MISLAILAMLIFSCKTSKVLDPPAKTVAVAKTENPSYTAVDLERGKTLYENNCATCHDLIDPKKHTAEQWQNFVPKMVELINQESIILNEKQEEDILRYVVTMASAK